MRRRVTATPLMQESLWAREFRWPDELEDGVLPERGERFSAKTVMEIFDNRSVTAGTPTR